MDDNIVSRNFNIMTDRPGGRRSKDETPVASFAADTFLKYLISNMRPAESGVNHALIGALWRFSISRQQEEPLSIKKKTLSYV